jgi:hypothetical protein
MPSPRKITALATPNTGMRLRTTAARPASTWTITILNSRKLSPNPPAPTSTATSQNRGADDTVPVPDPAVQRAVVTSSDTSAATVNCQVVSERASEPSSKRLATIV